MIEVICSDYRRAFKHLALDLPILGKLIKGMYGGTTSNTVKPTVQSVKVAIQPKQNLMRNPVHPQN
ncbi:unnamed protein product [Meloidogyne enterolobii]|uniref:Uncharacterized protein n=1 Tax=Meloidogyne enterolobii TaxID=390850 RepID=A0ACB0YI49_MELEN